MAPELKFPGPLLGSVSLSVINFESASRREVFVCQASRIQRVRNLPFSHLDPIYMSFGRTGTVGKHQLVAGGGMVGVQPSDEAMRLLKIICCQSSRPRVQSVPKAVGEHLCERSGKSCSCFQGYRGVVARMR